jgi:hypothetical protein
MCSEVILINSLNGLFETLFGFLYKIQFFKIKGSMSLAKMDNLEERGV